MPALFTSASTRPKADKALSAISPALASSETSATNGQGLAPSGFDLTSSPFSAFQIDVRGSYAGARFCQRKGVSPRPSPLPAPVTSTPLPERSNVTASPK